MAAQRARRRRKSNRWMMTRKNIMPHAERKTTKTTTLGWVEKLFYLGNSRNMKTTTHKHTQSPVIIILLFSVPHTHIFIIRHTMWLRIRFFIRWCWCGYVSARARAHTQNIGSLPPVPSPPSASRIPSYDFFSLDSQRLTMEWAKSISPCVPALLDGFLDSNVPHPHVIM